MDTNTPVFIRREHIDPPYEPGTQLPVYDLDFENANFRYREEEYNQYISKLNTAYADLNNKYQELTRVNTALGEENELLKRNATNDVRSIYALYAEANAKAIELEADNRTLTRELHLRDEDILIKTGEINHMHNVINELRDQLGRLDVNATVDFQELQRVISDQKNEIGDLRRKLNLSLDYKRKLEQENETLKFDIENLKSKYENELSEKDLRLNQAIRSVDNEVHSRTKDLTVQLTTYTKLEHDNIVLDKKNKELIHEIALHINAEKLLHQEIEHRERQIEALRRELEVFRDPKRKATLLSFRPSANTHLIKLCNNRFDREKAGYLFTIWRLRYALENESKFKLHNGPNQSVMRGENLKGSASKKIVFDFDNNSDISVATSLTDGVLRVLRYLREKASAMIFEVFVRSSDNAEQKKANSLILFSVNIKEIDDRAWKGLTLLLDVYTVIRRLMKTFHPKFVKLRKPAGAGVLEKQLSLSVGKLSSQKGEFRDRTQINRFIENSLVYIVNKRKYDEDPNREFLFLFRVLAIKYRVLYPMRGKELDIEEDLRAYLDHKILSSLQKVLKAHPKENQPLFDTKLVEDLEAQNLIAYDNA